ncbi:hypothetical protein HBI31_174080 [Parastagonospora nodorum]|nr:hypothetical protein HBI31_174080 [Parastagonospora nodorum]
MEKLLILSGSADFTIEYVLSVDNLAGITKALPRPTQGGAVVGNILVLLPLDTSSTSPHAHMHVLELTCLTLGVVHEGKEIKV